MLQRLKKIRLAKFLTQRELAEKAGISRVAIARIESGKTIARLITTRRLAEALGVEPQDLVGTDDR